MSLEIASWAARLISAGAGKSGKPWERFTALWRSARRVISRITDSVKRSALEERTGLAAAARSGWAGFIGLRSIDPAIDVRIARHDLHVLARLGERNRIHEFGRLAIGLSCCPSDHAVFSGIVRGQRRFSGAKLLDQIRDVGGAEPDVVVRIDEHGAGIADLLLLRQQARGRSDELHQSDGAFAGAGLRFKRGFLANQAGNEHRVHSRFRGPAPDGGFIRQSVGHAPHIARHLGERLRFELGEQDSNGDDGGAVVSRGGRRLGGFEQESRLAGGGISGAQLEFGRSVESNGAQGIGTRLAIHGVERNRTVEFGYRRYGRNRGKHIHVLGWTRAQRTYPRRGPR